MADCGGSYRSALVRVSDDPSRETRSGAQDNGDTSLHLERTVRRGHGASSIRGTTRVLSRALRAASARYPTPRTLSLPTLISVRPNNVRGSRGDVWESLSPNTTKRDL